MLNETEEFNAYTGTMGYCANGKYDSTYLGRFTYDMLLKFEGLARVQTIIARGYMFKDDSEPQIDYARRALWAWCSIPDSKKTSPKRTGNIKRILKIYIMSSWSLLMLMAVGGSIGMFIM